MRFQFCVAALAAGVLAGCAKSPDQIVPVSVPGYEYEKMSCADLQIERSRNLEIVNVLSTNQERARSNDTLGVLFLGLPLASMSGADKEGEVAVAKGRALTIRSALDAKRCAV